MITIRPILLKSFVALLALSIFMTGQPLQAQQKTDQSRPASAILDEINSLTMPSFDRDLDQSDPNYRADYFMKREKVLRKKIELIAELWHTHPDYDQLPNLLAQRWNIMNGELDMTNAVLIETKKEIASHPAARIEQEAEYARTQVFINRAYTGDKEANNAVVPTADAYAEKYPEDPRTPSMLATIAGRFTTDHREQITRYDSLIQKYPDNRSAKYWQGKIRQIKQIGKTFELSFKDAITDRSISMDELRGKVVVIDFWATWCGPCVAEMPHMKKLYSQYHDKGVEFLGISLDQPVDRGGLDQLKKYCKNNNINWPQYYQGNGWGSGFSVSWGINSIPAMFIVDREGNLFATDARGRLDTLIPQLLGSDMPTNTQDH